MFNKFKNFCKEVKRFVDKKVEVCKEIMANPQNRLVAGLIIIGAGIGIGGGLIASAYIHVPA